MIQCPVCDAAAATPLRPYRAASAIFDGLSLVQCAECSLVFANPMLTKEALAEYNFAYADNAHGGIGTNFEAVNFFSGIALLRLNHILSYGHLQRGDAPDSVLEIGPGNGYLCQHLRARNPSCRYYVIESDLSFHDHLRQLGAEVYGNLSQLKMTEGSVDLLIMSHVLEHFDNPMGFFADVLPLLSEGGVLFVELPCADYLFKEQDEPHLLFFDKSSVSKLFARLGLHDVHLSYHGREIDRILRAGTMRVRIGNKWRALLHRAGIDLYHRPAYIEDEHVWVALRDHEAHMEKDRPSWWLRALARKGN